MKSINVLSKRVACAAVSLLVLFSFPAFAGMRIAVLDFELNDLTLIPRTPEELERTASVAPLLREALMKRGGYELVAIDSDSQNEAAGSFGYLFDHPDVAAELGRRFGVDWVAVGRVHKPSFLFAYLKVHLVNVKTARIVRDYVVEVKGYLKKLTERGTVSLADQIDQTIRPKIGACHKPGQIEPPKPMFGIGDRFPIPVWRARGPWVAPTLGQRRSQMVVSSIDVGIVQADDESLQVGRLSFRKNSMRAKWR